MNHVPCRKVTWRNGSHGAPLALDRVTQKAFAFATSLLLLLHAATSPTHAQTLSQQLKNEPVELLARDARLQGNVVRGAILFTQPNLSCIKCHTSGIAKPSGPDLKGLGGEVTDVYLVESLLNPSKVIKQGFESANVLTSDGRTLSGRIVDESPESIELQLSTGELVRVKLERLSIDSIAASNVSSMPENLIDQLTSRQQFLDLVRYLMELSLADKAHSPLTNSSGRTEISPDLQGLVLLREFNCAACHQDDLTKVALNSKAAPDLLQSGRLIDPHFIQQFVADPLRVRDRTTMPDMMSHLSPAERRLAGEEIAHYLASLVDRQFPVERNDAEAAARGRELFHTVGCVACHSPRDGEGRELSRELSTPLGNLAEKYEIGGLISFLEEPLKYRPSGRMPNMQLSHWEAVDLANYLLAPGDSKSAKTLFQPDDRLAENGRARFVQLNCIQCHSLSAVDGKSMSRPMSQIRPEQGCLSGEDGAWPRFSLTEAQRGSIRAALRRSSQELDSREQIAVSITAMNCVNCHQRDEFGGVTEERDPYFQTVNPNLGPQGRLPPPLTGVGAKLNPTWLRQVLVAGRTIRPYVLTRMPQYGADNVAHLIDLFQRADVRSGEELADQQDSQELREAGAEMVGVGGLNCIACHTFQLQQAANMPAVDLTEMAERLRKEWFLGYMRSPQEYSPSTIMPSYWPAGQSMRADLLDGDREMQLEALWQYLLEGRQASTPRGLIVEPMALLATDEAVILRRSYPEIGKRGIGVGYPHQLNLAYDAEQMRLASLWKGRFADPAGVWRSQGHGTVRPLGGDLMHFAKGPDLDDAASPWTVDDGRPPSHQFKGYSLDDHRRPRFRYRFADVSVEDYWEDVVDAATQLPIFRRSVTLTTDVAREGLSFRAATGKSIERVAPGRYVIDGRLTICFSDELNAIVTDRSEFMALYLPLTLQSGATTLTLEYSW